MGALERVGAAGALLGLEESQAIGCGPGGREDDFDFIADQEVLGKTFDEQERDFGGVFTGRAIGDFNQEGRNDGANIAGAGDDVRKTQPILPAVAKCSAVMVMGSQSLAA